MKKTNSDNNPTSSASSKKHKAVNIVAAVVAALIVGCSACAVYYFRKSASGYKGEAVRIYVPASATAESVSDTLRTALGADFGSDVASLWSMRGGSPEVAHGSYVVVPGMKAAEVAKKLLRGAQDPVKVTFNNVRTLQQLASKATARLEITPEEFLAACDSVLPQRGYATADYPAAFQPDTYEFYWNAPAQKVVGVLVAYRSKYWTEARIARARAMGLKPAQVATVASIVEEETAKADERPMVARLYLNRLEKGMPLQADPTVKFATGDFSLRRITAEHLKIDSPYNTYIHPGLPPGPIRVVENSTLDAVLNAPEHPYLYMCAKEDFSGYHNFATTYAEHMANARRYHAELNRRGIR